MQDQLALVAIDRAELQVAAGEPGEVAALLSKTLGLADSGAARETQRMLRVLREAVVAGAGSAGRSSGR